MDTEETRETHNLYIERNRGNLKNIIQYLRFVTSEKEIRPYIPGSLRRRVFDMVHQMSHPSGRATHWQIAQKLM